MSASLHETGALFDDELRPMYRATDPDRPRLFSQERINAALVRRFHAGYVVTDAGCWEWTRHQDGKGYGVISVRSIDGKWSTAKTHRVAYELLVGPIPGGLQLDHLCRNRICCNPDHLEPVTNRENAIRGYGWSGINARKTHCPQGHEFTPENTMTKTTAFGTIGRECRLCSKLMQRKRVDAKRRAGEFRCACGLHFQTQRGLSVHVAKRPCVTHQAGAA